MASFAISEWSYRVNFVDAIIFELLFLPARLFAVYINWFLLIPKLLYRAKFTWYVLLLVGILVIAGIGQRYFILFWGYPKFFPEWVTDTIINPWDISRLVQTVLIIVSPVAFTTGFKLFWSWFQNRNETESLRQEKTDAELKFLKSQTNPHFLFNTLNSLYGLALAKSDKTPALILKLSDILSYTLYESNNDRVALDKEITLIENIIALEKERYDKRVSTDFITSGSTVGIKIPPLLLVPFVENAFKHGLKNEVAKGFIKINLHADINRLEFKIENSFLDNEDDVGGNGGLGLKNVARRLDLIYGDQKELEILKTSTSYIVHLKIRFSEK